MGSIVHGTATAGMNGPKTITVTAGARATCDQPKDDRFSSLLATSATPAPATPTQTEAQKPAQAQKSAQTPTQKPATAGTENPQMPDSKNIAAGHGQKTPATPDHDDNTRADKAGNTAAPDEATLYTDIERTDKNQDQDHQTDDTGNQTAPAVAQDGIPILPATVKDPGTKDADAKDTDTKDTDTKSADKKDDGGKKPDPGQAQNGNAIPAASANTLQATIGAGQTAASANTAIANKSSSSNATSTNAANVPGIVASGAGTLINVTSPTPATKADGRGNSKREVQDTGKAQAPAQSGSQNTATVSNAAGDTATNTANNPTADMLAALKTQAGNHFKNADISQSANSNTAAAQNTPTPTALPSQQNAQNNSPAPVGSLTVQGMIPDPSTLGAGSTGMGSPILTAAATASPGAGAGTSASGTTFLPQALQINQMPLPLPNMAALGIAIATRSLSGSRQFDIRLDPPELGRVDVRLSIDSTGKTQAHLSADQQQTLELLQKDSSGLARALRDAGLNVAQNGLNFSLRQHSSGGGGTNHGGFSPRGARTQALSAVASLTSAPSPLSLGVLPHFSNGHGRLDISV